MAFSQFDRVPNHYAGSVIQRIKDFRAGERRTRRDLNPTLLRIGDLEILVPRHFGFCFGVERAIHMAFSALENNPGTKINLVSQIIHNPLVNRDLEERGIRFVYDDQGKRRIAEKDINGDDIVLIPAFGTTLEIEDSLKRSGIDTSTEEFSQNYDTTCPFVSKVWNRGEQLGNEGYTIVIHGKFGHEETQATHSHTKEHSKTLVVLDRAEAEQLASFITGDLPRADFDRLFAGKASADFDPDRDLERLAVVNQTTMLAEETQEVAAIVRQAIVQRYGDDKIEHHFADTRDTLCYATNENQNATKALLRSAADLALIIGGYNSSNTSHLLEICSEVMPSYLISDSNEMQSAEEIWHFDITSRQRRRDTGWLPAAPQTRIVVASGASCPDILMNQVIEKVADFYGYGTSDIEAGLKNLTVFSAETAT
jgi:4-hydroxy-3-methylbut-2-en-1-yl diphosphate reductase